MVKDLGQFPSLDPTTGKIRPKHTPVSEDGVHKSQLEKYYSELALVDGIVWSRTELPPPWWVDAVRAIGKTPVVMAELEANIPAVAAAINNPESVLNGELSDFFDVKLGGKSDSFILVVKTTIDNINAARPDWVGIVEWWVRLGSVVPTNYKPGDIVVEVTTEAAPWRPSDHPYLAGWWNPDNAGVADGATVQSLPDTSINGWTLVQTVAGNRPTLRKNGINGMAALQFTGTQFLQTLAIAGSNRIPSSFYVVVKGGEPVNSGGSKFFMDLRSGTTSLGGAMGRSAANKWNYVAGATTATTVDSDDQGRILNARVQGDGSTEILVNNVVRATVAANTSRPTFDGIVMGARGDGLNGWNGYIGDMIMTTSPSSGTVHGQTIGYLASKYSITV